MRAKERLGNMSEKRTDSIDATSPARVSGLVRGARKGSAYMYAWFTAVSSCRNALARLDIT